MYGGHFMDWVVRTRGLEAVQRAYVAFSDEVVPFSVNRASWEASGETYTQQYRAWKAALVATAQAEKAALVAQGLTPHQLLTDSGRRHANPRFLPDGTLLSLEGGRKPEGVYARRLDQPPAPPTTVVELDATGAFDVCPRGQLVHDQKTRHRVAYSRTDLHLYDPATRERRRLTSGARIRQPACSPDGTWAAAVQITTGRTRLVRVNLDDGEVRTLFDPGGLDQGAFPRFDPDGRVGVFVLARQRRGRDLHLLDLATNEVRAITRDDALELHPAFSPDGRWLVYASDRGGVFDLYARPWPTGPERRLTRVLTGALDPAISRGGRLAFRMITADGYDLAEMPFDPEAGPTSPPLEPAALTLPRGDPGDAPLLERRYDPLETVWPVAWAPAFSFSNAAESAAQIGLDVEAADVARHHVLTGSFSTAPEEDALGASLGYSYQRLAPRLGFSLQRGTRTGEGAFHGNAPQPFRERVTSGSATIALPLGDADVGVTTTARYSLTATEPAENTDPVHDPLDASTFLPEPERFGSLSLSLRLGAADAYAFAVSSEQGRTASVSVRIRHPHLGGELRTAELFLDYQEFLPLWWRHVLAFRAHTSFGRGDSGRRVFYALGAPPERNLFLDALDSKFFGSAFLRGYPAGSETGDRFLLLTAEYRLPLLDVFGGPSMVPIYLSRLKLGLFSDWGQARSEPLDPEPSAFRRSAGAEIVTESILGWRLNLSARTGYAYGFDDDGEHQFYFFLGNWF